MPANPAKRGRPSPHAIFSSDLVTIKVGATAKEYCAHKALLMHYSGYFRGVLGSNNFEEGTSKIVMLVDTNENTLTTFLKWLYSGDLPQLSEWVRENLANYDASTVECMILVYIFADRFLVPELTKCMSNLIFAHTKDCPPGVNAVAAAFNGLHSDSPLLRMLVDSYCRWFDPNLDDIEECGEVQLPIEFYKCLAYRLATKANQLEDQELKYSDYEEPEMDASQISGPTPSKKRKTTHV